MGIRPHGFVKLAKGVSGAGGAACTAQAEAASAAERQILRHLCASYDATGSGELTIESDGVVIWGPVQVYDHFELHFGEGDGIPSVALGERLSAVLEGVGALVGQVSFGYKVQG